MDQPILNFIRQTPQQADCTIASLAMYLGISYPEALVAVALVKPNVLAVGTEWSDLRRALRKRKIRFEEHRKFSLDDDSEDAGILAVEGIDGKQHAVYLRRGLIFDGRTDSVWDADVYLRVHNVTAVSLLVRKK
jgi:hypothetical protein